MRSFQTHIIIKRYRKEKMGFRKNGLVTIDNKVFSKKNIQHIIKMAWDEYLEAREKSKSPTFKIHVKCFGNVSFECDDIQLFDDESVLYSENIKSIELQVSCEEALTIKLSVNDGRELSHDSHFKTNEIEIGSDNIAKTHDLQRRYHDYIYAIRPQNNPIYKTRKVMASVIFIIGTVSLGFLVDRQNLNSKDYVPFWVTASKSISDFVGSVIAAGLFGGLLPLIFYYSLLVGKSKEYWPNVEIEIGPVRPEIEKRQVYIWILRGLIIPLLLSLIYDILKFIAL